MNIGLLGGTFDPIHKGHIKLGLAALTQLNLSCVYFILAPKSPFKFRHRMASPTDRLQLLKLADIAVGLRPGARYIHIPMRFKEKVTVLKGRFPNFSSTAIRVFLKKGRRISSALPKSVYNHIKKNNLYT